MKTSRHQDPEWRAALHTRLDALLDLRAELEQEAGIGHEEDNALLGHRSYAHLSTTPIGPKAQQLLKAAAAILAEAVGTRLRCAALQMPANDGPQKRLVLREWLGMLEPILNVPQPSLISAFGHECLAEHTVWLGLRALDVGEVWPIFQPGNRGNRPANLYSLSVARLSALEWKRRLISLGQTEGEANRQITAAFGEQWDTIRKWEASCAATLGKLLVKASLEQAETSEKWQAHRTGLFGTSSGDWPARLQRAGENYRSEKRRAAELSPAKRKAAQRSERQGS